MTVRLLGVTLTDLHGSLHNVRIVGPDGIELKTTEGIANLPPVTFY